MSSALDRYLTPPDPAPEMDAEDEERLVVEIALKEFGAYFPASAPDVRAMALQRLDAWLRAKMHANDELHCVLVDHYREEIDARWAEEHEPDEGARADYEYETRRDDRLTGDD